MKKLLIGAGIVVVIGIAVQQLSRTRAGREFWDSVAEHENQLRARLLPSEDTLALARERRARPGGRHSLNRFDDVDIYDVDDVTDDF